MKDQLSKGIASVIGKVRNMGAAMQKFGTIMASIGGAGLAAMGGMVKHFTDAGSALNDMSARTGVAASTLAELKFAAEMTGASLEDVETAIKKSQKNGKDFFATADAIAAIQDPAERTRQALEEWGKSGTKLLPMIANLKELRAEANAKGLVPTEESIKMADALGDKFDSVWKIIQAGAFEVGAALAPILMPVVSLVEEIAVATIKWVKENGELIRTVGMIVAGVTAAGAVIATIGASIAFLATPFGAVVAAVAAIGAGVALWMRYTESGKAAFGEIVRVFQEIQEFASSIGDALIAGDIALAGQIVVKQLQLIFQQGLTGISAMIGGLLGAAIGKIGTKVIAGDLKGAWDSTVTGMAAVWDTLVAGMATAFKAAIDNIRSILRTVTTQISATATMLAGIAEASGAPGSKAIANALRGAGAISGAAGAGADAKLGTVASVAGLVKQATAAKAARSMLEAVEELGPGTGEAALEIARLVAQLEELKGKARAGREAALGKFAGTAPEDAFSSPGKGFATFSAAALQANVSGKGRDPIVDRLDKLLKAHEKELKHLRGIDKLEGARFGF